MTGSLASYHHESSSWRTSQRSLFGGLVAWSETWPREGMTRNGELFRLADQVAAARHIDGNEYSLWPTPTARDWKDVGCLDNVPENGLLGRVFKNRTGQNLSPTFSEWLMGFPEGWTELTDCDA